MKQMTLAAGRGFEKHARATRKAEFLARMESLMPWGEFCALIEPHYSKAGNGRPPVGLERMLRCPGPDFSGHEFGVKPCREKGAGNAEEEGCREGCAGVAGRSA